VQTETAAQRTTAVTIGGCEVHLQIPLAIPIDCKPGQDDPEPGADLTVVKRGALVDEDLPVLARLIRIANDLRPSAPVRLRRARVNAFVCLMTC
jgi:hypothetical protein